MSDFVHSTPTTHNTIVPSQIPAAGTNVSKAIEPAQVNSLSGWRATVAVIFVFIFAGVALYYRYQPRVDAFFESGRERQISGKPAKPIKPVSEKVKYADRPTIEPPLPTIVRSNQPPQLYFGR